MRNETTIFLEKYDSNIRQLSPKAVTDRSRRCPNKADRIQTWPHAFRLHLITSKSNAKWRIEITPLRLAFRHAITEYAFSFGAIVLADISNDFNK